MEKRRNISNEEKNKFINELKNFEEQNGDIVSDINNDSKVRKSNSTIFYEIETDDPPFFVSIKKFINSKNISRQKLNDIFGSTTAYNLEYSLKDKKRKSITSRNLERWLLVLNADIVFVSK